MKQCRCCGNSVDDIADICNSCGYNFKTDIVDPNFVPKQSPNDKANSGLSNKYVSSGVKKFAIIGLIVVVFSVLYKYNFNMNDVVSDAGIMFNKIMPGGMTKGKEGKNKSSEIKKVELINVMSFVSPDKAGKYKDLKIEGISFDANAKSFVIINGKVISEGEEFNKVIVKKINPDSVELIAAGKLLVLRINQSIPFPD